MRAHPPEDTIREDTIEEIARFFRVEAGGLGLGTRLRRDLRAGSFDLVELLGALEERFDIALSDLAFRKVRTVQDVATAVSDALHFRDVLVDEAESVLRVGVQD